MLLSYTLRSCIIAQNYASDVIIIMFQNKYKATFNITWLAWNHFEMCSYRRLNTFIKSSYLLWNTRLLVSFSKHYYLRKWVNLQEKIINAYVDRHTYTCTLPFICPFTVCTLYTDHITWISRCTVPVKFFQPFYFMLPLMDIGTVWNILWYFLCIVQHDLFTETDQKDVWADKEFLDAIQIFFHNIYLLYKYSVICFIYIYIYIYIYI